MASAGPSTAPPDPQPNGFVAPKEIIALFDLTKVKKAARDRIAA